MLQILCCNLNCKLYFCLIILFSVWCYERLTWKLRWRLLKRWCIPLHFSTFRFVVYAHNKRHFTICMNSIGVEVLAVGTTSVTLFRVLILCSWMRTRLVGAAKRLHLNSSTPATFLSGFLFECDHRGDMFIRNICNTRRNISEEHNLHDFYSSKPRMNTIT
jgi:hypothetical protein